MRELARRSGLTATTISDIEGDKANIGQQACNAIARAFNLPPEEVFRRAGILPPAPERTPGLKEAEFLFTKLSPERRSLILATMRAWVDSAETATEKPV